MREPFAVTPTRGDVLDLVHDVHGHAGVVAYERRAHRNPHFTRVSVYEPLLDLVTGNLAGHQAPRWSSAASWSSGWVRSRSETPSISSAARPSICASARVNAEQLALGRRECHPDRCVFERGPEPFLCFAELGFRPPTFGHVARVHHHPFDGGVVDEVGAHRLQDP